MALSVWIVVFAVLGLCAVGIASIYVTDTAALKGADGPLNAARQSIRLLAGIVVAAIVMRIGRPRIARSSYWIYAAALGVLLPPVLARVLHTTFAGFIPPRNGAYRWFRFPGFELQPSEFMKIALVLILAAYLQHGTRARQLSGVIAALMATFIPVALVLLEPDLGTALLFVPVAFAMLFVAGARIRHLLPIALLGIAAIPIAWSFIEPYQRLRVTAVLLQSDSLRQAVIRNPESYEWIATRRQALEWSAGSGYQLLHARTAIGSGGWRGCGWGEGLYIEDRILPEGHNDFIFAMIGHQWGFAGCVFVIACYLAFALAGARMARAAADPFGRLLAVGVVTMICGQAVVNMTMAVGLLPTTGMTLPFVSYGGSSLLANVISVALLLGAVRFRPFLLTERPVTFTREQLETIAGRSASPVAASVISDSTAR